MSTHITPCCETARRHATFDPALVRINRKRFSATQGEVEVEYDGIRIEQFGDTITMGKDGLFQGLPDDFWIEVARRHHQQGS